MPVTAADLPEELFKTILTFLAHSFNPDSTRPQPQTKRALSACSLACRYWASIARANIFHNIILRSAKDLDTLFALLDSPKSAVRSYVRRVVLQQDGMTKVPWAHRLYTKLDRFEHLERLYHEIKAERHFFVPGPIAYTVRSVHEGLPRSLPSLFFRCTALHVNNIRFLDFTDLLNLVGEMSCEEVDLVEVSWLTSPKPDSLPPLMRKFKRTTQSRVRAYACTNAEPWRMFWFCVTTKEPGGPVVGQYVPYVHPGEMALLDQLFRWAGSTSSHGHAGTPDESAREEAVRCGAMEFRTTFGYQRFILHLSCPLSKPCSPEYELFFSNGRVVQLRVVYSEGGQEKPLSDHDWEGLDRLLSPFAHVESVIITAHTANGDLSKQESAIVNRMPLLRDRLDEKIMFRTMERVVADSRWH